MEVRCANRKVERLYTEKSQISTIFGWARQVGAADWSPSEAMISTPNSRLETYRHRLRRQSRCSGGFEVVDYH